MLFDINQKEEKDSGFTAYFVGSLVPCYCCSLDKLDSKGSYLVLLKEDKESQNLDPVVARAPLSLLLVHRTFL